MTEREALLAAVCENPDDDTPRLVFADWLQENGESQRAAYIRASVAQWRLEKADTPSTAMYDFLYSMGGYVGGKALLDPIDWSSVDAELAAIYAAEKLMKAVRLPRLALAEGLPTIRGVKFDTWDVGGFHNEVIVRNPSAFLTNAEAIFRAAPIYYLNFKGQALTAEQAREFVSAGHLARVRWLRFYSIEPEAIRVLGDNRDAACVTRIQLYCTERASEQVEQLVAGTHWTGLTHLTVTNLHAGPDEEAADENAIRILRCPAVRRLRELFLFSNRIGDEAARVVAAGGFTELRTLDLADNVIGTDGAAALAETKLLPNLRNLDFHRNRVCGAEGTSKLIVSPTLQSLTALRLWGCGDGSGGLDVATLAKPCRGPTLRALELECGPVTTRGLAALAKCAAAQGLWYLSLRASGVTDTGLRALTRSDGFRQLTVLDLAKNGLTARGAESLAKWPAPIQSLDLTGNTVGVAGAKLLIASEHRQGLKRLMVSGRGVAKLRKHFGKKVLP